MVLFVGARQFKAELLTTMSFFVEDSNPRVRKTIAHSIHEVCALTFLSILLYQYAHQVASLLGNNGHLLLPDLIKLLQDEMVDVRIINMHKRYAYFSL
jgi:hypothetical protein